MSQQLSDTDPKARRVLINLLRQASAARKIELAGQLNRLARAFALSDLRMQHPTASGAELNRYLADRLLGPQLAERVYGPLKEPGRG